MAKLALPYETGTLVDHVSHGTIRANALIGLLFARSLLCFLAQASFALAFLLQGDPDPWLASVPYWNVFGTLADIGCLFLLRHYLSKEGIKIRELLRAPQTIPQWRDVLIGIGLFLVIFPTAIMGMTILANLVVYGELQPDLGSGLLINRQLPIWATLYSLLVWAVIWSITESTYYNGYLFPRIEVFTKRTWKAVVIVGFFWSLQHIFFPFMPDAKYLIWRFIQFLGIALLMPLLFSRLRRLRPLIGTHWLMDFTGVLLTISF